MEGKRQCLCRWGLESWSPGGLRLRGGGDEFTRSRCQIYLSSSCLINPDGERVESGRLRGRQL